MIEIKVLRMEIAFLIKEKLPSQYSKNVHYLNKIILRSNEAFAIFN
jgi:hypothetical protein